MMNAETCREYFKEFVLTVMHLNCPIIVDKFLLPTKKKKSVLKGLVLLDFLLLLLLLSIILIAILINS